MEGRHLRRATRARARSRRRTAFIRNNGLLERRAELHRASRTAASHVGCPVQPGGPVFDDRREDGQDAPTATSTDHARAARGRLHLPVPRRLPTTRRATASPARRCAGSTATSSDIVDGRLVLGDLLQRRARSRARARPPRSRGPARTARASTSTAPRPGSTRCSRRTDGDHADRQPGARLEQRASCYPLDWLEERSGLVGGITLLPLPQGPRATRAGGTRSARRR